MNLISAILPTRGRQEYARQAVECFLAQDYPRKELVILDDEEMPSFPNGIDFSVGEARLGMPIDIAYRQYRGRSIADKRNVACGLTTGDIICHFDSDDWSAPGRISHQIDLMERSGKHVVGYHSMYFYSEIEKRAVWYDGSFGCDSLGTSLMYTSDWWQRHPFQQQTTAWGEDNVFAKCAKDYEQLYRTDAGLMMVARAHTDNTSYKHMGPESIQYRSVDLSALPADFPR